MTTYSMPTFGGCKCGHRCGRLIEMKDKRNYVSSTTMCLRCGREYVQKFNKTGQLLEIKYEDESKLLNICNTTMNEYQRDHGRHPDFERIVETRDMWIWLNYRNQKVEPYLITCFELLDYYLQPCICPTCGFFKPIPPELANPEVCCGVCQEYASSSKKG